MPRGSRSTAIRRAIERRLAIANLVGGQFAAAYLVALNDVEDPDTPVAEVWVSVLGTSLTGAVLGAVIIVLVGRFVAGPRLRFLDEDRAATPQEREFLLAWPRRTTLAVYGGWTFAAFFIGGWLLIADDWKGALGAFVGNLFAGLIVGNVSYLVSQRWLRSAYEVIFADTPPEERVHFGARRRLLLAWSLGSGIPLLGVALAPVLRARDAIVPAVVPMVILACAGLIVGVFMTLSEADALADPMSRLRQAMARVRGGDLETSVAIDSPGEVGLVQAGFNEMVAGLREHQQLQDLFGRHVGEEVARRAVGEGVRLGGERRDASVLFVDLIGSSALARERAPEDVVATLNRFFTAVVDTVAMEGGWVNEFEGDGALCVFGAPADLPDHAGAALRAARRLHMRLEAMSVDAGIGVASGEVVAGNIGSERRFEYTVIGHPVNVASRLTDAAKHHPARVLSASAGDGWEPAGTLDLKGVGAVEIYAPATGTAALPAEGGSYGCSKEEQREGRAGFAGRPKHD